MEGLDGSFLLSLVSLWSRVDSGQQRFCDSVVRTAFLGENPVGAGIGSWGLGDGEAVRGKTEARRGWEGGLGSAL